MNINFKKLKTLLKALKMFFFLIAIIEFLLAGFSIIYLIRDTNISETELSLLETLLNCTQDDLTTVLLSTIVSSIINFACLYLTYYWLKMAIKKEDIFDEQLADDLKRLRDVTLVGFFIHLIATAVIYYLTDIDTMSNIIALFPLSLVDSIIYYLLKYGYDIKNNIINNELVEKEEGEE